jgi:hypothetical protein
MINDHEMDGFTEHTEHTDAGCRKASGERTIDYPSVS